MSDPFLQSGAWAAFQSHYGRRVIRDHGTTWSYLAVVESGTLNRRLYTPHGPVFTTNDDFAAALSSLKKQAKKERATFIRIEPLASITPQQLTQQGFKKVTYNQLQPEHTQMIDLTVDRDSLLSQMSQNSRNITRNYHKKDITITTSQRPEDISILTSLLAGVAERTGMRPHSSAYFQAQADSLFPIGAATLYIASHEATPIAAALVYDSESTRYYAHAAADSNYRKLAAGTALVGQLILDAKQKGLAAVDLYGIAPSNDPTHPWAGFTKFKQSFGGTAVSYVGAWDLPVRPLAYWLYRCYQRIARLRRR